MTRQPSTDDAVERLLRNFFVREMPQELRALPDRPEPLRRPASDGPAPRFGSPDRRPRHRWSVVGLSAAGLVACGVVAAVVNQPDTDHTVPRTTTVAPTAQPADTAAPRRDIAESSLPVGVGSADDDADAAPLIIVEDGNRPKRKTVGTARGPVEQRSGLQWANIGTSDEPTEMPTDYAAPSEATIEILPLEQDAVSPRTTPTAPDDPRLPEERAGTR